MAAKLAEGLRRLNIDPCFRVEANAVFVSLPPHVHETLQRNGHGYYPFGDPEWNMSRLMCSFDTTEEDVRNLLNDIEAALR
jgi:threonine aldolase